MTIDMKLLVHKTREGLELGADRATNRVVPDDPAAVKKELPNEKSSS
jgi:hypothetical protein